MRERLGRRLGRRAWAAGAAGEEKPAQTLAGLEGLHILHDRRVPGSRRNIDHIVASPPGVFVVDAKRYSGLIQVRDVGGLLRRDERLFVGRRDCSALAAAMAWQFPAVAAALSDAGLEPLPPIMPVLCFVDGEWPHLSPPTPIWAVDATSLLFLHLAGRDRVVRRRGPA